MGVVGRQSKNVLGIHSEAGAVALIARSAIFACISGDKVGIRCVIEPAVEFGAEFVSLCLPIPELCETVLCPPKRRFAR